MLQIVGLIYSDDASIVDMTCSIEAVPPDGGAVAELGAVEFCHTSGAIQRQSKATLSLCTVECHGRIGINEWMNGYLTTYHMLSTRYEWTREPYVSNRPGMLKHVICLCSPCKENGK